jgi:hypothetical protein
MDDPHNLDQKRVEVIVAKTKIKFFNPQTKYVFALARFCIVPPEEKSPALENQN